MQNKFRYKAWANAEILGALAQLDPARHPDQWKQAIRLMNHTWVVDRIFAAHLEGTVHAFDATNTAGTPGLDQLRECIAHSDAWFLDYVDRIGDERRHEVVRFSFTDGNAGTMTRDEMLFHVLAHGAYHRGNVGMILAACGMDRPNDTFTRFLHLVEPERRVLPEP